MNRLPSDRPIRVGDNDVVIEGAFESFEGTVVAIHDDDGKLIVMINVFGRETPVELPIEQVRRI
jgi:transcriptional antiterminator NusG